MSNLAKVFIPTVLLLAIYVIYQISGQDEIGLFEKYKSSGEINQNIKVYVVTEKGFSRDASNRIVAFIAKDKNGVESRISLNNPAPPDLPQAEIVELFGHMHGPDFVAASVTVVKLAE